MKSVSMHDLATKKIPWNKLFDNEDELVTAMMNCKTQRGDGKNGFIPKGYEYIASFQRYYANTGSLTPKQMTQLKRLSKPIYASVNDMRATGCMAIYA